MWTACLPTLGPGLIDGASPLPGERSGIEFTEGLCVMCVNGVYAHTRAVGQASSRGIFVAGLVYILFIVVFRCRFDVVYSAFEDVEHAIYRLSCIAARARAPAALRPRTSTNPRISLNAQRAGDM